MMSEKKRCGDCEYFVAFRNMNYETCTCDTITEYCELLQNEDTYDRDKGDEILNDVFDDCPLQTGYVSIESAILLLQSKKEVHKQFDNYVRISSEKKKKLQDENEQLQKKLECCEYEHFLDELDEIHEKVDKGDLSDFSPLKEDKSLNDYNPLKEKLYYWQCKYYRRDYEYRMDMCTRCNYNGLLNYCLKDKCDKMVKSDYEVTVTDFESGVSIGLKKRVDKW